MTSAITQIERARGFLEAARLSDDSVKDMGKQALIKEAHHTTHIEGTRPTFYMKIQSVRENDMDMTGWLDYFITGLEIQMIEVKELGERVIRRDILKQKHNLNERQAKAIEYILQNDRLTIQNYEGLCPEVNRRSLQRDLKLMIEKKLISSEGATNQLVYFLKV